MRLPRISIGWMMFCVAMFCVAFALLRNAPKGRPLTGYGVTTDMGLWPTLTAFGAATFSILKNHGKRPPFLLGVRGLPVGFPSFVLRHLLDAASRVSPTLLLLQ